MRWPPDAAAIASLFPALGPLPGNPDRELVRSLDTAARRREHERARIVRSWRAAQRARERAARRAARALPRSAALGATLLAVGLPAGGAAGEVCAGVGALFGVRAVFALATLAAGRRHPAAEPPPELPPALPIPPPVHSAAFPAVRRLHAAGPALRRLLLTARGSGPAARMSADAAMTAAAESEQAMHAWASQVAALESARSAVVDPAARAALDSALDPLLRALEDGVTGYERLVGAAADLAAAVAMAVGPAGADGTGPVGLGRAAARVQDATDSLTGLAHGLRTVTAIESTAFSDTAVSDTAVSDTAVPDTAVSGTVGWWPTASAGHLRP